MRILFLCTGNSCRSQMAEGWVRHLKSGQIEARSAGTDPQGLNRLAVRAMSEVGIDISLYRSQHLDDFLTSAAQGQPVRLPILLRQLQCLL